MTRSEELWLFKWDQKGLERFVTQTPQLLTYNPAPLVQPGQLLGVPTRDRHWDLLSEDDVRPSEPSSSRLQDGRGPYGDNDAEQVEAEPEADVRGMPGQGSGRQTRTAPSTLSITPFRML